MVRVLSMIVVLAVSGSSLAQRPPQAPPIDQRVADLERKVAKLEQKVKALKSGVAAAPAQAPPVMASGVVTGDFTSGTCANGSCGAAGVEGVWYPGKRVISRFRR